MIQLNYFIRSFHNGNVVRSCGWIENRFLLQLVNNLIIYLALWRKREGGGGGVSETEMLKRHEDDCQFNDNYSLGDKKILKSTEKKHIELWIPARGEVLTVSLPAI